MVISRESPCLSDIIVEGITEDFVDVEEEGVQEGVIVDGGGNGHSSQLLEALYIHRLKGFDSKPVYSS